MNIIDQQRNENPYARAIAASKKARFDIERDVIRGRRLDPSHKFLPDGLSFVERIPSLSEDERRIVSQVQGRTYANLFGLVERFINAKVVELEGEHALGDQIALEALVRFSDEELKHQELFRRVEALAAAAMPPGYRSAADPDAVARLVLGKSTWAVLALTCHIELFSQAHYKQSIADDPALSPLFKDVFLHHFKEESQHAVIDELEWRRIDRALDEGSRDRAVDELIELVQAVDGLIAGQAQLDSEYAAELFGRAVSSEEQRTMADVFLAAYRFQYILSGLTQTRFPAILLELSGERAFARVEAALWPLLR